MLFQWPHRPSSKDPSTNFQIEYLISLPKQKFGDCLINLTSFFFVMRTNLNVSADKHHFRNILILINGFLQCLKSIISIGASLILNSCSPESQEVGTEFRLGGHCRALRQSFRLVCRTCMGDSVNSLSFFFSLFSHFQVPRGELNYSLLQKWLLMILKTQVK